MDQLELDLGVPIDVSKTHENPMVRAYGLGPENKRCKHCQHLFIQQYANRYYKCGLRINTNGPGTDQRINWRACSKFKEEVKHQKN